MVTRCITTVVLGALVGLGATACSGDESSQPVGMRHDLADFADVSNAPGYVPPIDPSSRYVRSLCAIDFVAMMDGDDQLSAIADALSAVPAEGEVQTAERQRMLDLIEPITDFSDPAAIGAIVEIGDVLRARCS
jgi:hypothetical protein